MDESPPPGADAETLLSVSRGLGDLALHRLERYVSTETPSGDPSAIAAMNQLLVEAYEGTGGCVTRVPGPAGDHLVGVWPAAASSGGHTLLIGHSDTVFPLGTCAQRPFRVNGDGVLTGPGVFDMKGALVEVELAMRVIDVTKSQLRRPLRLVVVCDEELGSPDGGRLVEAQTPEAVAVIGLEPPLPGGALKVGRRGVARYLLAVSGVEAHAGLDADVGISAIDELVDQLTRLRSAATVDDSFSLNVGRVGGGTRANVVAGSAQAEIGLRFATPQGEQAALAILDSLAPLRPGASVAVTRLSHRPAWAPDPHNPVAAQFQRMGQALGISVALGVSGGGGDTNAPGAAGIPTVDGLGPDGAGAHAPTEWASLPSLLERAALLAGYLTN